MWIYVYVPSEKISTSWVKISFGRLSYIAQSLWVRFLSYFFTSPENECAACKQAMFERASWRHQMETFSALLALCAGNSPHKGQWRGALMFSLICASINDWVNNREAGDLRPHRALYDVTVMETPENWLGLVNNCVYYDRQAREIYQVLPYLVDFTSPGALESTG